MTQKSMACANCVSSMPGGLGNVGRLALITGNVTWVDPDWGGVGSAFSAEPFPNGSYSVAIDDGSNLINYPRNMGVISMTADFNNYQFPADAMAPEAFKGLRVIIDCNTAGGVYDLDHQPLVGDRLSLVGIVGYRSFWEYWKAPMTLTERALLYPVVTKL